MRFHISVMADVNFFRLRIAVAKFTHSFEFRFFWINDSEVGETIDHCLGNIRFVFPQIQNILCRNSKINIQTDNGYLNIEIEFKFNYHIQQAVLNSMSHSLHYHFHRVHLRRFGCFQHFPRQS